MKNLRLSANGLTANGLILAVAAFLTAFGNATFVTNVLRIYPVSAGNVLPLLSLIIILAGTTVILLAVLCIGRATKPALIVVLLLSSLAAYFMDSYGVVIGEDMLRNIAQTHAAEVRDLLSFKLLAYVTVLGVLPAILLGRVRVRWRGLRVEAASRLALVGITLSVVAVLVLSFGSFYASFVREYKALRSYANPAHYVYSAIKYAGRALTPPTNDILAAIGLDARIPEWDTHRELIVMVVGETARADRFSLNGYTRDTNPLLAKLGAISFTNVWACGTSTAVSVPCMFSLDGQTQGKLFGGTKKENLLDVLQRSGVNVLWRDNNSDSKGVALRVPYQDFRSQGINPVCDVECRDEGMLHGLQAYIDAHPKGDIFIVLHQLGNHGPAYYRRYPAAFERFKPACRSNALNTCSREEIDNAYDNAILYTDHFLAKAIELLEQNDERFETALFYVSDHGESLGEGGVYLHAMPKLIAPEAQLHVPVLMWFGKNFDDVDLPALRQLRHARFTHANIFHTVLGFFEIETSIYRTELDILQGARPQHERLAAQPASR